MPAVGKNGVRMYQRIRRYIDKIYLYGILKTGAVQPAETGIGKDRAGIITTGRWLS